MLKLLVASSKGGCGKSTIASNLAAYFALKGKATVLADADRQGSSRNWCEKRAALDSAVLPLDANAQGLAKNTFRTTPIAWSSIPGPASGPARLPSSSMT
jgi:chromosome partitioning protein